MAMDYHDKEVNGTSTHEKDFKSCYIRDDRNGILQNNCLNCKYRAWKEFDGAGASC